MRPNYVLPARNLETFFSRTGVASADRDPPGADSRTLDATIGRRSKTEALSGVVATTAGKLVPEAGSGDTAETGVPMAVDDELLKDGESSITDSNAATDGLGPGPEGPGNDGDEITPGAGNEGESTIIPGICIGTRAEEF